MGKPGSRHASGEDLVAYADGYLAGRRLAAVEGHLRACPRCRAHLAAFREVDRVVRTGVAPVDDPGGLAALRARMAARAGRPVRPGPRQRPAAALALLALLLGALAWPLASTAGFPLGEILRFGPVPIERGGGSEGGGLDLTGVAMPGPGNPDPAFPAVEPERLPLALERVERSVPEAGQIEQLYRSEAGLAVLLAQTPAGDPAVTLHSRWAGEVILVRGTEVLVLPAPWPGAAAGLVWARAGVAFELLVTESPPRGLAVSDAAGIVEALAAAQDAAAE